MPEVSKPSEWAKNEAERLRVVYGLTYNGNGNAIAAALDAAWIEGRNSARQLVFDSLDDIKKVPDAYWLCIAIERLTPDDKEEG